MEIVPFYFIRLIMKMKDLIDVDPFTRILRGYKLRGMGQLFF